MILRHDPLDGITQQRDIGRGLRQVAMQAELYMTIDKPKRLTGLRREINKLLKRVSIVDMKHLMGLIIPRDNVGYRLARRFRDVDEDDGLGIQG